MMKGTQARITVGAIVLAAGSSTRMNGVDKVFADVAGQPLLWWSLAAFCSTPEVERVALVLRTDQIDRGRELVKRSGWLDRAVVCAGGERRQDSVAAGLQALGACEWVLIHDGARPCITPSFVRLTLESARETGAAVPGLPVTDTLKQVDSAEAVAQTVDRAPLRAVQTPQGFRYAIIAAAHDRATRDVTDDAALVEAMGVPVRVFPGLPHNVKVTTPTDLELAAFWLARMGVTPPAVHER